MSKSPRRSVVPHHRLVSLSVTGGFLDGLEAQFTDGLNCVIGGRGTGKTTVLEFVRYSLGLMPDPKKHPTRHRAIERLVKQNLGSGQIRLTVETKHGVRYTTERSWNQKPRVVDEKGAEREFSLGEDLVFRGHVYSRSEILSIAGSPNRQLQLIDRFVAEDVRRVAGELKRAGRELDDSASTLVRLDQEIRALGDTAAEAPALEARLAELREKGGTDSEKLNAAHAGKARRERERETVETARRDLTRGLTEIDGLIGAAASRLGSRIPSGFVTGPNEAVLADVARELSTATAALETARKTIHERLDKAAEALLGHTATLSRRHASQEQEYQTLVASSAAANETAAERGKLEARHAQVATAANELAARRKERDALVVKRQELLGKLSTLRDERFRLRKRVAERLTRELRGEIKVSISQAASTVAYQALLTKAIKGKGLQYRDVATRLAKNLSPSELSLAVRERDAAGLGDKIGVTADRASKVIDRLAEGSHLYRIEAVELEDRPRLKLRDGDQYKDSRNLSTGQRCTTVLAIMLLEDEAVLMIDQPENELDNAFVYDTIVPLLRSLGSRRQLIFVTHNANIPVVGNAERVFVLESDGTRSRLKAEGTVDALREEIERILEGGAPAFEYRWRRYGH